MENIRCTDVVDARLIDVANALFTSDASAPRTFLRALPAALHPSGEIYRDTGNPAKAHTLFREANAILRGLANANRVSQCDAENAVKLIKARLATCDRFTWLDLSRCFYLHLKRFPRPSIWHTQLCQHNAHTFPTHQRTCAVVETI